MNFYKVKKCDNEELVSEIEKQLKENDGYCPCRLNKTEETKCMCKEFREQIKNHKLGECHCGLFEVVKEN